MRRFLLLSHRVPVRGGFTLNDLAGGAGRMDEIARAVSTAFTLSNDLRRDTEVTILFSAESPPASRRIVVHGSRVRFLNPDERSTAALLKNALVRSVEASGTIESSPGLVVGPVVPDVALREFLRLPGTVWMNEHGQPIGEYPVPPGDFGAVVSDPYDPTEAETEILRASGVPRVAVGPRPLRTSQVIDAVHNDLDRREAGGRPSKAG
jgi:tRNA (pseudouridine54-N1)-methyltransferase